MSTDILGPALIQTMARDLGIADLIRTAETLKRSGQTQSQETLYAAWVRHNAGHPLAYAVLFNYSVVLSDAGRLEAARECLERAIALNPDFMPAYINLGRIHERMGNAGMALVQWSAALTRTAQVTGSAVAHKTTTLNQSARALEAANQDEAAEAMLRQSLELDPHQHEAAQHFVALRQRQCEWPVISPPERLGKAALRAAMSPLSAAAYADDPLLQLAIAWNYNNREVGTPLNARGSWPGAERAGGPLRIGYLSSDLREHAVGYLAAELLQLHDRKAVETFAYYCGIDARDPLHGHFKATADHWRAIGSLDDEAAAQVIAEDGVQILVDLNGYTRDARLKLVGLRPAPVIVNWLGYPGTMASPYHHYLIADDWIVPEAHEAFFSERVLRLPCYQPNNRKRIVSAKPLSRGEAGLPAEGMVYCCFNGAHKIGQFTFERWMTILAGVPGSVLWLLGGAASTTQRLRRHAEQFGIAAERLVFAEKLANAHHLARYPLADLFLDSAPYGAHTTASDALWMGLPVLTLSGRSFAARVCGSLVRAAGVPELICAAPGEFVERAIAFGRNRDSIRPFRERLAAGRDSCTLFDTPKLVRNLERLYGEMWLQFKRGRLPRPNLANLDAYLEIGSRLDYDDIEAQTIGDYEGWWRDRLARRHRCRPIVGESRICVEAGA